MEMEIASATRSFKAWLPTEKKRWESLPARKRKDLIDWKKSQDLIQWWLKSPSLGSQTRAGFEKLQVRLSSDRNFRETFNRVLESFQKLRCNPHVLYWHCASFFGAELPKHSELLVILRRLRGLETTKKLSRLPETAVLLEEIILPALSRYARKGYFPAFSEWLKLPTHLRDVHGAALKMLGVTRHLTRQRGSPPQQGPQLQVAIMTDYFKTRTGARQLELVGNISGLLGLGDQSKVRVQQRCRSFDAMRRRTTDNPLVLLDAALRS